MASKQLNELIEQADALSREEQLQLIAHLTASMEQGPNGPIRKGRRWSEIRGAAPYPMLGEDAQQWVTRTRREADEHREQQLKGPR